MDTQCFGNFLGELGGWPAAEQTAGVRHASKYSYIYHGNSNPVFLEWKFMIMNLLYPVLRVSRYTMALFFGSYHVTPCRHHRWLLFEGTDVFKLTHLPAEIEQWKRGIDTAGDRTFFFNVTFRMSPGKKQPDAFAITTLNSPLWTFQEGFQVGTALKWPQAFLQFSKPFAKTHQPYQSFLHTVNPFWVWIGATRILSMISFFPHSISWASVSRFGFNKFVQEVLPV